MNHKLIFLATFGAVIATAMTPVNAALSWNFANGMGNCTIGTTNADCYGNSVTRTSTGGTTNFNSTARAYSDTGAGGVIQTAYLASWSGGLGVANQNTSGRDPYEGTPRATTAPEHSTDSQGNGTANIYDSVLFTFANAVKLTQITLGWAQTDSDISVLAWQGSVAPTSLSTGAQTYASLITAGWALVGQYSNVAGDPVSSSGGSRLINGADNVDNTTNSAVYSSKYWLVGAYNPVFDNSNWTSGNDYVKIKSVAGVTGGQKVPEPGSMALVALAVAGALSMKGRKRKSS